MAVPSTALPTISTKVDDKEDIAHAYFRWVMAAAASSPSSSSLTIGEKNKEINAPRANAWIVLVCLPAIIMAAPACLAYSMYNDPVPAVAGSPWSLAVMTLSCVYLAVVELAIWHSTLSLPEAPYAAMEALVDLGLVKISIAVVLTSGLAMLFDDYARWILVAWCCLAVVLIAAVLAFWICLVRIYGKNSKGGELAISLPLSSLLTAALLATYIHLVSSMPQHKE